MSPPHTARLADAFNALVDASVAADPSAVEAALAAVEHRIVDIEPRRGVPLAQTVAVFQRDCWTCRYCAGRTIAPPVLRLLSRLHPDRFPYHPNWKAGQVHPPICCCPPRSTTSSPVAAAVRGAPLRTWS